MPFPVLNYNMRLGNRRFGPVWAFLICISTATQTFGATTATGSLDSYSSIVERNAFGLRPAIAEPTQPQPPPTDDVILTGLVGMDGTRRAMFMVVTGGKPTSFFALPEGESNDWVEIKSISFDTGTVTMIGKKPIISARNPGTETTLSFPVPSTSTKATPK